MAASMDISAVANSLPGGVSGMVAQYQRGFPGEGARDASSRRQNSRAAVSARHGIAEHGEIRPGSVGQRGRPRPRSRDRQERPDLNQQLRDMGPENRQDFDNIIEGITDRLDTIERFQRLHAQSLAFCDEGITGNRKLMSEMDADITKYKEYITYIHQKIDKYVNEQFRCLAAQNESFVSAMAPRVDQLDQRVMVMEAHLQDDSGATRRQAPEHQPQQSQAASTRPEDFTIATVRHEPQTPPPEPAAPQVPQYMVQDPWFHAAQELPGRRIRSDGFSQDPDRVGIPEIRDAPAANIATPEIRPSLPPQIQERPSAPVAMPQSFAMGNGPPLGSPFVHGQDPFRTPIHGHGTGHYPGAGAWEGGRPSMFEPSRKENKLLFVFTGEAKDYKMFRNRVTDHLCRSTQKWRHVLDFILTGHSMIRQSWLQSTNVCGVNAWDLSTILEAFLVDWLPKSMYTRRTQLAGGEFGNGFEMWRRLYIEYHGGMSAVEYGGVRRLQEFPRCTQMSKLSEHLDDWVDVLTTYGSELEHCPKLLRNMILGVIPTELETEILEKENDPMCYDRAVFRDYTGIIRWCKAKVAAKRSKELSELTRRPPTSHLKGMMGLEEQEGAQSSSTLPPWAVEISNNNKRIIDMLSNSIASNSVGQSQNLPSSDEQAPPPPMPLINAVRPGPKPRPKPKAGARFTFKGCWHCGKDEAGHTRKNCTAFEKMLRQANPGITDRKMMKLPSDYKGAYELAREKAGLSIRRRRLNMLDDEDFEDDDESDFGDYPGRIAALREDRGQKISSQSFESPNSFQALAEADVPPPPPRPQHIKFGRAKGSGWVKSERDLENLLKRDPRIAAIPTSGKQIRRVLRTMPAELVCGVDEVLCLVDSGSTVNAAWISKHFPAYAALVQQTAASLQGDGATTACGRKLLNKGRCLIGATCQGSDFSVAFKDMETDLPILSVRKMIKMGSDVEFHDGGGSIRNRRTGQVLLFYEHEGVYFIKFKIKDPACRDIITENHQGFQRQGM